ncbi:hypothetical protein LWC35_22370 [Pseudonocardia kujensis]|uniref:hypothetical protein n=1 Tax=Pseudonocardia kujensis TaxID=1128675 RepID=UPI001E64C455|nr:hypothetical protein [Pseudonocardia kujensis]MCE0765628.1 hypothetical protein [Pseudonocardia kujensis]
MPLTPVDEAGSETVGNGADRAGGERGMVAVPEIEGIGTPAQRRGGPARIPPARRRLVAVAVSPMELLRPESDLARLVADAGRVDLLLARADAPAAPATPVPVPPVPVPPVSLVSPEGVTSLPVSLDRVDVRFDGADAPGHVDEWDDLDGDLDEYDDEYGDDEYGEDDEDGDEDGVAAAVEALGLQDVHVHRLGLPGRIGAAAEDDLVAALSELVGFDPEPGVYCVAPLPSPADPERTTVVAAVQRVVRVYGLPLLRYRSLELSVVGSDA